MPRNQNAEPEVRCGCGSLLARQVAGGIELKCRRCRRAVLLRLHDDGRVTIEDSPAWARR